MKKKRCEFTLCDQIFVDKHGICYLQIALDGNPSRPSWQLIADARKWTWYHLYVSIPSGIAMQNYNRTCIDFAHPSSWRFCPFIFLACSHWIRINRLKRQNTETQYNRTISGFTKLLKINLLVLISFRLKFNTTAESSNAFFRFKFSSHQPLNSNEFSS